MMFKRLIILILVSLLLVSCTSKNEETKTDLGLNRVFYEIFVGSFSDSNKDGIGDLKGIINRLDYLEELGINGIWLTPIFESDSYHKYDVNDYYKIDSDFGTMDDLKLLIDKCHEKDIYIIIDMVLNHTSDNNQWFKDFKQAQINHDEKNKYYDYYSYTNENELDYSRVFYRIDNTENFYEANFSRNMPELNFNNANLRNELLDIAKYYLDLGVDGFRFDAAKYIYLNNREQTIDFWRWYCDSLRNYKNDIYLISEVWSSNNEIRKYSEIMNCFNFEFSQDNGYIANAAKGNNINRYIEYVDTLQKVLKGYRKDGMIVPFISNHDMDRSSEYLTMNDYSAYMAANLYLLLPGSPFIYYGEEIGLKGLRGNSNTDANRRLAMYWEDGDSVSNPEGADYPIFLQANGSVKKQDKESESLLNHYRKVLNIRNKYPAIAMGDYTKLSFSKNNLGGFKIDYNDETIYLIHNTSNQDITIENDQFTKILDYIGHNKPKLNGNKLTVKAYSSIILE